MASNDGSNVSLVVKWAGKEYSIDNVAISSTVNDLKSAIHAKTNVLPSRQKLLNLRFKGKAPTDDQSLTSLNLKNGFKIMMMGSVEQAIQGNYFIEQLQCSDVNLKTTFCEFLFYIIMSPYILGTLLLQNFARKLIKLIL